MISIISFSQLRFYINNQTNKILIKIDFILINNQKNDQHAIQIQLTINTNQ